jgi:rubrerythrin
VSTEVSAAVRTIRSTEELLAYTLAMEKEAVERFNDLADQMEVHHNFEVAELFRQLATIEGRHVENVRQAAAGMELPAVLAWEFEWEGGTSPEGGWMEDAHYLMQPWHAIELALGGERRAVAFFRHVAKTATEDSVAQMALELAAEEKQHVALLEQWQQRFPQPRQDWDADLDPPITPG